MAHKIFAFVFACCFVFLLPLTAAAQLPPPFRIGGTLTVNDTPITSDNDAGYTVRAVKSDGTPFVPAAEDTDGIDPISGWYRIDVPIFDAAEQPGGADPGSEAMIEVLFNGQPFTVTTPPNGIFTVGGSGELRQIDVEVRQQSANQPPTADAGPDQIVTEGELTTLNGIGSSDPDPGDTLSFQWEQIDAGAPVTLSDPTAPQPTFTAPEITGTERILEFRLTVTDNDGQTAADEVSVTVRTSGAQPPTADAGSDQTVTEGAVVILNGANSSTPDPADTLVYEWEQISGTPSISLSDRFDPRPTFVAPDVAPGPQISLVFQLTVENSADLTDSDTVTVTVLPVGNQPPKADAGSPQVVVEGTEVFLNGLESSDPDPGDTLSYQWDQTDGPLVMLSDDTDPQPSFIAPDVAGAGTLFLEFLLSVRDDQNATDTDRVAITVTETPTGPNQPPTADAGPDRIAVTGDRVLLDGTGSRDSDGTIIAYQWDQIDGDIPVALSGASQPEASFTAPHIQNSQVLRFQLRVIDNNGGEDTDEVTVTLLGDGQMPVADAGPDRTVREGDYAVLDGSRSHAPVGDIVSFQWVQTGGPIGVDISNPNGSKTTFFAPSVDSESLLTFQLTVTTDSGITDLDTVQYTILDAGPGPGDDDSTCFISTLH
ncbi:MAG: PKD domain-containing protein [Thermodesulfobacteriota bacterium]